MTAPFACVRSEPDGHFRAGFDGEDAGVLADVRAVAAGVGHHRGYATVRVQDARAALPEDRAAITVVELRVGFAGGIAFEPDEPDAGLSEGVAAGDHPRVIRLAEVEAAGHGEEPLPGARFEFAPCLERRRGKRGVGSARVGMADDPALAVAAAPFMADGELLEEDDPLASARRRIGGRRPHGASADHGKVKAGHRASTVRGRTSGTQ
ncbi:MAG: hypothetical protein IT301_14870 [Dehalococcoidia bacterium]|nr:hypothetical protein [Dehalococcoidia bacterium]